MKEAEAHPVTVEGRALPVNIPTYTIIGGERRRLAGEKIATLDPGSGTHLTDVPAGGPDDVDAAVDAAKRAFKGTWATMEPRDRSRLLTSIGDAIDAESEHLALVETLDSGKPLKDARRSVQRAADYFRYYAGLIDKDLGRTIPLGPDRVSFTERVPIGVTAHIVPWNVPISTVARSVAPALACGNSAVVKPAEDTPLSAVILVELMERSGLPPGVVNVVTGRGAVAGQALAEHPEVGHITFTGSVDTGKKVMTAAASHVASVTLELGGKSPHVVLADADLIAASKNVAANVFSNAGQICSAGTRLLVERRIHPEMVGLLVQHANSIRVGYGLDDPDMGPLISLKQLNRVEGFVERARERGVEIPAGGVRPVVPGHENGFYYAPTIADHVPEDDELAQCEVFGPVLSVIPVDGLDHAIEVANGTAYGLAAGIHTRNISSALRFARAVEAGQIYVNGYHAAGDTVPFGGMKESGMGREKGVEALAAYSEIKAVTIKL